MWRLSEEAEAGYDVEQNVVSRINEILLGPEVADEEEVTDLVQLAKAFSQLYIMALNGVVCSPSDPNICLNCARTWAQGKEILDKIDPNWEF